MTDPEPSASPPSVPRETAEPIFGDRLPLAEAYAASLATAGIARGLIGPREVPRLWQRHLLNCAVLADAVPAGAREVADVGSGAGLPGVVLAIRRPDLQVTLVEPMQRRCAYLTEVVEELGLSGVEVVRARAEELAGTRRFEVVTARALAPLPRLLAWTMPLLEPCGVLLAMKGGSAEQEVLAARAELAGSTVAVERYGAGWGLEPTTVVRVRPDRSERRVGASSGRGARVRTEPRDRPQEMTGNGSRRQHGRRHGSSTNEVSS